MPPAQGWTQAHSQSPYLTESVVTRYLYSSGVSDVPVSFSQGGLSQQTAEDVQLNQPQSRKVVEFEFVRQSEAPLIPNYVTNDPNEVLLTVEVAFEDPKIGPDGLHYIFKTSGRYLYMLKQPLPIIASKWPIGPADAGQPQDVVFSTG